MSPAVTGGGPEPPPVPRDASPAPRRGLSNNAIGFIVLGVLAIAFASCVAIMLPKMREPQRQEACASNLSELGALYVAAVQGDPEKARRWSGSSLWLAMRKGGVVLRRGQERVLLCRGDSSVSVPDSKEEQAAWDDVDLEHPSRDLCSYAGRDFANFPVDPADGLPQAIGACIHHRGVAIVAFDDGSVRKMSREELGLAPEDDIVCGPDSKSPLLRMLLGGN